MNGNDHRGIVLQERDRHLLRELAVMRVIDREQAKTVARFGSTTRANLRLLLLTRTWLLKRFFLGTTAGGRKALYALSKKGAQVVDVAYRGLQRRRDEALITDLFVQHQLTVNQLYCDLKYGVIPVPGVTFSRWIAFYQPLAPQLRLVPDGYAELKTAQGVLASFLEVDRGSESLTVWKEKVRNYLQFAVSGECERQFAQSRFRVLVVARSERRMLSIRRVVAASTEKIFWLTSLEAIRLHGFWDCVWLRPVGEDRQPLIRQIP